MEQFVEELKYQKTAPVILGPLGENTADEKKIKNFNFAEPESAAIYPDVFRKNLYCKIDKLFGLKSCEIINFKNDFFYPKLNRVLSFLLKEGVVSDYLIGDNKFTDAPQFYHFDLAPAFPDNATDGRLLMKYIGHGFGKNPENVYSKAIGEFLERYFFLIYKKDKLIRSSSVNFKKNKYNCLDINDLPQFSDWQKKENPMFQSDETSVFYWEKGTRYSTKENYYLPAQLVYWNYRRDESEPFLCEPNTNGAGGFFDAEGALLSGIYELIQRDAFFVYWLNKIPPVRIQPESVPNDNFQKIYRESLKYGFKIYCLNFKNQFNVPVVAVILADCTGIGPRYVIGAGCENNMSDALLRAIEESWGIYYWMRRKPFFPALDLKTYKPFRDKRIGQFERLRLWSNPEMSGHLSFFLSENIINYDEAASEYKRNIAFKSAKEELNNLVSRIEKFGKGYEVLCKHAKHPILDKLNFYAVQVVVPKLIQLYTQETHAPLGTKRIKEAARQLNFCPDDSVNILPHIFP